MKILVPLITTLLVGWITALDWWEHGNFYQVYPRSFKDSDGDGIGDLDGVTEKLQYLKDIGMDGIWLSPIFASPMADFGYDVSNFRQIQPEYGNLAAFQRLSDKCKKLKLHLILDFVPNHTSDEHEYFIESVKQNSTYKDFYIWHPGVVDPSNANRKAPPSNWISDFRGSAWEWNEQRQEYYLHQFLKKQPDLNYRNPAVVEEMKNVLRYWLDRGVSGFRVDAVPYLFESAERQGRYVDEERSYVTNDTENPAYLIHSQTKDQPETYDMINQWRAVLDEYTKKDNRTRIMMTEGYTSLPKIIEFFGNATANGAHLPFNFELMSNIRRTSNATDFAIYVKRWLDAKPANKRSNWVLGNHDNSRIGSRLGNNKIDLFNIALQTLPDIAVTYYGEEIGMLDQWVSWAETKDPAACKTNAATYSTYSRDPARTPMQWSTAKNAGFSTAAKTWLPVAENYKSLNVKMQDRARKSHLKIFKKLTKYRKRLILTEGDIDIKVSGGGNLLVYKRKVDKVGYVVVALNFGTEAVKLGLSNLYDRAEQKMQVVLSSDRVTTSDNTWIDVDSYQLLGESGIVLQYLWGKNPIVS